MDVASYDHRPSDVPFLGETIGRCLRRVARKQGDREAVVSAHEGVRLTYRDLLSRAEDVARGLLSLGVAKGDRVAVWSTNTVGWVVIQHATALVGAVLVNVNPAFRSHELEHVLKASRARVLFLGQGFRGTPYPDMLYELCPEIQASKGARATCEMLTALEWAVTLSSRSHPDMMTLADLERRGVTVSSDAIHVGEICFRGYHVMRRYDGDPGATVEAVDAQGWLHSGDLGTMDVDGYVKIVGRIKEMVIRGGENVYPRENEEFLHTLDIVVDAYVVGVPDYKYGEELMAWVSLAPGIEPPSADEFREMCRGRIASFKIPRYWKVVDEFPMTVTGKAQKFEMRARAIEELGLRAATEVRTA